jgi:signal peptidase II
MQAARGASLSSPSDDKTTRPPVRSRRRHLLLFGLIAGVAYAVDVVTKVLAVEHLTGQPRVPLVGDFFSLYLTYNSGAAFSFLTGHTEVLAAVALVAVVVVVWIARRLGSTGWAIALGFLLGGVLGNLTDRLVREPGVMRGHVVDFFMLPNFPVFNVADICINIAAGTIILQALRGINVDGSRHDDSSDDRSGTQGKPGETGEATAT